MLESFRRIDIEVDYCNDYLPPVRLSGDDRNGRVIRFSVTDAGAPVTGEGLTARLLYNSAPGVSMGSYVDMAAVPDQQTATFEAAVPTDFARGGDMCVQLRMGDTEVCTRHMRVVSERRLIDDTSSEALNMQNVLLEILAMKDSVVEVNGHFERTEVDGFETVIVKDLGLYKDKNGDICQVEEA